MDVSTFIRHFPRLYHLTFAANLPGIREHGLLSVSGLAALHSFTPEERQVTLETRRRCIQHLHGIEICDQHTASETRMKSCLVKISIPEWLALLNTKVFLFPSRERSQRLLDAYQDYDNVLLEIDSARLLATHADNITLCRISSGSFIHNPRPRGRDSFIPLAAYVFKNKRDTPAEISVDVPISNIMHMATPVSLSPADVTPA